jgi:hypothetical protein
MLEGDVNLASFESLVSDSGSRSGSGKAEKVEKCHIGTEEQDYCPNRTGGFYWSKEVPM